MTATDHTDVSSTPRNNQDNAKAFVKFIICCCENNGSRAALRSGLGRTVDNIDRRHAYVARWTSEDRPDEEAAYYTVAALIAHKPEDAWPIEPVGNIGASLARSRVLARDTKEASIHLLARQPASSICRAVTRVVLPLRGPDKAEAVDFVLLLTELASWPTTFRRTGRSWLQSYYRTIAKVDGTTTETGSASEITESPIVHVGQPHND